MKRIFNRVLFTLMFLFIVFSINNVYASDWNSNNSLPSSEGNYKHTSDVVINSTWNVPDGVTTIDSNSPYLKNTDDPKTVTVIKSSFTAPAGKSFLKWNDLNETQIYPFVVQIGN